MSYVPLTEQPYISGRRLASGRPERMSDGLWLQLKRIPGVTKGKTAKLLVTPYVFQCPPLDSFSVPRTRSLSTWTNFEGDEFVGKGGKQAIKLGFRTIVAEAGQFIMHKDFDLDGLIYDLNVIEEEGYPVDLLATHKYTKGTNPIHGDTRPRPELHIEAILDGVTKTENAGEQDARYLDLSFTQWPNPTTARRTSNLEYPFTITLRKDGRHIDSPAAAAFGPKVKPRGWVGEPPVVTLALLAKYAYGKPSLWQHIAKAQKPPLTDWGAHTAMIDHGRYRGKGGKIIIPSPPDQDH